MDDIPIISRRTLIWLDIEGYEYSVLKGIKELTTKPIIVFEINPALISSTQKSPNLFIKNLLKFQLVLELFQPFSFLSVKKAYNGCILLPLT